MAAMVLIIMSIIALDQLTKYYARKELKYGKIEKPPFSFKLVYNKGAFRGGLKAYPLLLVSIQALAILLIGGLILFYGLIKKDRSTSWALALMLGGAVGNFVDRIHMGKVTDFFAVKWTKDLYYNVADMFVFLGGLWILILEIKRYITKG